MWYFDDPCEHLKEGWNEFERLEFVIFVLVLKGCMISVMAMRTHTFVAIVKPAFFFLQLSFMDVCLYIDCYGRCEYVAHDALHLRMDSFHFDLF